MENTNVRIINTRLVETKFYEILSSVLGQLSDGIWENSPSMTKYWTNIHVNQNENNEICIEVNANYFTKWCNTSVANPFINMSENEIKFWFAQKIKQIVKKEEQDNNGTKWWKRDNTRELDYMGYKEKITVQDAYKLYDIMKCRDISNKY